MKARHWRTFAGLSVLSPPAAHQLAIPALRQDIRFAYQPPDPRTQRVGSIVPVLRHARLAKQNGPDLALDRAVGQRVMDAQQLDAAFDPGVARVKRAGKTAIVLEMEEAAQRQDARLGAAEAMQAIVQMNQRLTCQTALRDIEPDMVTTVRENGMVVSARIGDDGQPGGDSFQIEAIGIGAVGRGRDNGQGRGIEIGMPDDPRLGCRPGRIFSESAAPTLADPRCRG